MELEQLEKVMKLLHTIGELADERGSVLNV
jgi:hypothetical protein